MRKKYNTYDLTGEYGIGYTLKGEEFYFDLEDYDKIKDYCWGIVDGGYLKARIGNKNVLIHRYLLDPDRNMVIDHINHNKLDNRKENLRICTNRENCMNQDKSKNNKSGYKGVYYNKLSNKWESSIKIHGKSIYLGIFSNKEEAFEKYKEAERYYFKEFQYFERISNK